MCCCCCFGLTSVLLLPLKIAWWVVFVSLVMSIPHAAWAGEGKTTVTLAIVAFVLYSPRTAPARWKSIGQFIEKRVAVTPSIRRPRR